MRFLRSMRSMRFMRFMRTDRRWGFADRGRWEETGAHRVCQKR